MKYIQSALTIGSDEMEGQQTVDFSQIDACSIDGGFTKTPLLTPEQIIEMFHLNDPNIEGSIQDYKGGYSGIIVPENMDMNKR